MSAADFLDQVEARANAATGGPWFPVGPDDEYVRSGDVVGAGEPGARDIICERAGNDSVFIAHARTDVPALVAALRAVLAEHPAVPVYSMADSCGDDTDAHADAHHIEGGVEGGEWLCAGDVWCGECRDVDGDYITYPCPTVRAIESALGGGSDA